MKEESEVVVTEGDLEITYFKSSGPGGQHKNKRETAVRVRHIPTGVTVTAGEERSQALNREVALERLRRKLAALRKKRKPRIGTRPTRASIERRLRAKKLRGEKKGHRGKSDPEE